jgi:hypothetical protein
MDEGMARRIRLESHLTVEELERRYRAAKELHERSWYQILWLLAKGRLAREIAESTGYSRYWIGQVAHRYNTHGPEGMVNLAIHALASGAAHPLSRAAGRIGRGRTWPGA